MCHETCTSKRSKWSSFYHTIRFTHNNCKYRRIRKCHSLLARSSDTRLVCLRYTTAVSTVCSNVKDWCSTARADVCGARLCSSVKQPIRNDHSLFKRKKSLFLVSIHATKSYFRPRYQEKYSYCVLLMSNKQMAKSILGTSKGGFFPDSDMYVQKCKRR